MSAIPAFLIIGAQKAGTTAAARNLSTHPSVRVFSGTTEYGQRELEFYNQHWNRGVEWYSSHFANGPHLNGEKTAELLHRTVCHSRMYKVNPNFKLIVLLRNPVERAYSQWKMARFVKADEDDSFEAVILRELGSLADQAAADRFHACYDEGRACWREGYIRKGMYAEHIRSVLEWFPRSNVFIGISEQFRKNKSASYNRIFDFLGVQPFCGAFAEHFVSPRSPPLSSRVRKKLSEIYREPNRQLFSLIGSEVPEWS